MSEETISSEFICVEHGHDACPECAHDLAAAQVELKNYAECINGHNSPGWTCIACGSEVVDRLQHQNQKLLDSLQEMYDTFPCSHIVTFKPNSCCVCRAKRALGEEEKA